MFSDWKYLLSIVTSVVTSIVAIFAVILTCKQIRLSNKQHLFDKRLENYIIATGLIQLYRSNCNYINNEKDTPILSNHMDFEFLTNNTYLEQITCAIYNPLKESSQKELLIKLENLKEVATKIKFLFADNVSILLGDFVLRYQELLFEMYKYQTCIKEINKENENHKLTLEEIAQKVGEKTCRVRLQEAFDNLKKADSALKMANVEDQIKKQIKLY
ncbi:hypothetical protein [Clostridium felsineum]|uniref:hypothetical protein n=1 Tax=Clostridium felsineum TaxID=36839 RepID=UPI00098CEDAA|nr:hypothetical protein [Clostridium felsineum]URZ02726.1 hypothetical protein CLAUR_027500 [Clostridium felsineum]